MQHQGLKGVAWANVLPGVLGQFCLGLSARFARDELCDLLRMICTICLGQSSSSAQDDLHDLSGMKCMTLYNKLHKMLNVARKMGPCPPDDRQNVL